MQQEQSPAYQAGFALGQGVGFMCCPLTCLSIFVALMAGGIVWALRRRQP